MHMRLCSSARSHVHAHACAHERAIACVQTDRPKELEELVGQQRLADKVTGILQRIERELDTVDSRIGEAMHVLDVDNDGLVGC